MHESRPVSVLQYMIALIELIMGPWWRKFGPGAGPAEQLEGGGLELSLSVAKGQGPVPAALLATPTQSVSPVDDATIALVWYAYPHKNGHLEVKRRCGRKGKSIRSKHVFREWVPYPSTKNQF